MKKIIAIFLTIILLGCTGCSKNENSSDTSGEVFSEAGSDITASSNKSNSPIGGESNVTGGGNVKEVTENYDADFESCLNTEFVNLDWTNAGKCPVEPVSEVYNIKCEDTLAVDEIPIADMLDKFKEYCNFYLGEYRDEFAFFMPEFDKDDKEFPLLPSIEVDGVSYRNYYIISEHREKIVTNEVKVNYFVYRNIEQNKYLWWCYYYPHWINKGSALTAIGDKTNKCSSWIPSDMGEPVARYYNDEKNYDVKYKLADDEVSIGDAIKYFTEKYPDTLPFDNKPEYSVKYVDVYKINENTYGYLLNAALKHNFLSFEILGEMQTDSSTPYFYATDGQAFMVKKDDIDVIHDCDPKFMMENDGDPILNILSLKEAIDIVSEKMTQNVKFNVLSTDLVYHGTRDEENIARLKPTWEFKLFNPNDNVNYNVYVDAVSGECNYFSYVSM